MIGTMIVAMALAGTEPTQCEGAVETVQSAYVDGTWRKRDADLVYAGFHPQFVMQVMRNGELRSMSIQEWQPRERLDGTPNEDKVDAKLALIDCSGAMATVRGELSVNGELRFIDMLNLYRFEDGWKIVTKSFVMP